LLLVLLQLCTLHTQLQQSEQKQKISQRNKKIKPTTPKPSDISHPKKHSAKTVKQFK
jgi:hypothetical protein